MNNKVKKLWKNLTAICFLVLIVLVLVFLQNNKEYSVASKVEDIYEEISKDIVHMSKYSGKKLSSSNPYDYIENCQAYDRLVELGEEALLEIYSIIKNSNGGLTSYILAIAMEDIVNCNMYEAVGIDWSTSEEFISAWDLFLTKSNEVVSDTIKNEFKEHNEIFNVPIVTRGGKKDYKYYYKFVECKDCEVGYDQKDKDSNGNPRQYGVKLCEKHKDKIAENSLFYDYGYTDYNCMAYALGKDEPCSWTWPSSWGKFADTKEVTKYFKWRGYTVEEFDETKYDTYKDKKAILVYGYMSSMYEEYKIVHFARLNTIGGQNLPEGQKTISKWGPAGIYTTQELNPYGEYSGYGECVMVCYK